VRTASVLREDETDRNVVRADVHILEAAGKGILRDRHAVFDRRGCLQLVDGTAHICRNLRVDTGSAKLRILSVDVVCIRMFFDGRRRDTECCYWCRHILRRVWFENEYRTEENKRETADNRECASFHIP
jgi:hypothetical protein